MRICSAVYRTEPSPASDSFAVQLPTPGRETGATGGESLVSHQWRESGKPSVARRAPQFPALEKSQMCAPTLNPCPAPPPKLRNNFPESEWRMPHNHRGSKCSTHTGDKYFYCCVGGVCQVVPPVKPCGAAADADILCCTPSTLSTPSTEFSAARNILLPDAPGSI